MNSEEGGAMMEFLIFVAVAFSRPVLVLGLLQIVAPQSSLHEGVRRRLAQFKLWQLGERQVKAYPRTQTDRRTVGKANGRRIIGAFRKAMFGSTFRFV